MTKEQAFLQRVKDIRQKYEGPIAEARAKHERIEALQAELRQLCGDPRDEFCGRPLYKAQADLYEELEDAWRAFRNEVGQ